MQQRFSTCNGTMLRSSCSDLLLVLLHLYFDNSMVTSNMEGATRIDFLCNNVALKIVVKNRPV